MEIEIKNQREVPFCTLNPGDTFAFFHGVKEVAIKTKTSSDGNNATWLSSDAFSFRVSSDEEVIPVKTKLIVDYNDTDEEG